MLVSYLSCLRVDPNSELINCVCRNNMSCLQKRGKHSDAARARSDVDDLPYSPGGGPGYGTRSFEDTVNMGMTTTAAPAVSFQEADDSADPALELEVLKCILLREGYLTRLESEARKGGRALIANKAAASKLVRTLKHERSLVQFTCVAVQHSRAE